jgi:quercetin dioxygenase-like cupin family protein
MKTMLAFGFLSGAMVMAAGAAEPPVVWPSKDIQWKDSGAVKGAKIAVLWGDPAKGAYGALKKVPAGTEFGLHTHTQDQRVVQVSGTILLQEEGKAEKALDAGSFMFMPGGVKHTAKCTAAADCIYFEEQPGAADLKMVEGVKKDPEAKK